MTTVATTPTVKGLLAETGTSVTDILAALATKPTPPPVEDRVKPSVVVPVSDEQKKILKKIVDRAEAFKFPGEIRELTEDEQREAIEIFTDLKQGIAALGNFETAFKATFHNHLDAEAVRLGTDAGALQNKDGHLLVGGQLAPSGLSVLIRRELSGGGAASLTLADLRDMEERGDITHKEFLALTTEGTRVVNSEAVMKHVRKVPEFTKVLKRYAKLTAATASINVRPNKVKK